MFEKKIQEQQQRDSRDVRDLLNAISSETLESNIMSIEVLTNDYGLKKCAICHEYNLDSDLTDTEQSLGLGELCEECLKDNGEMI